MNRGKLFALMLIVLGLLIAPMSASAADVVQEWKLVTPDGVVNIAPMKLAPRLTSLEGKTVVLQWNGKTNGDNFLNPIAEMLTQQFKGIKIIKAWELAPELKTISQNQANSQKIADKIAAWKPDLVIASQAD
jgi:ABC-type Fe3+-hydroxamate transport system substrate-binding protein